MNNGQVQIPIFINPIGTSKSLDHTLANSYLVRDLESLQTTAQNIYSKPYPNITSLDDLLRQLSEVVIRFDNGAKFLTKEDLGHLCKLLQGSLIYLYQVSGGDGEFARLEAMINDLDQALSERITNDETKYDDYFHFGGIVADKEELDAIPVEQLHKGDFYRAGTDEYIWNGRVWILLGPDVSIFATTEWVLQQLQGLTKTLISQGEGITVTEIKQNNVVIGYEIAVDETIAKQEDLEALIQKVADEYYNKEDINSTVNGINDQITAINTTLNNKMNKDGSNYVGDLALVQPFISPEWDIKKQDNTHVVTSTQASLTVERGAVIDFSGVASYYNPSELQKAPTSISGNFIFGEDALISDRLEVAGITSNRTFTCTLSAPKSGLIVSNNKVVKATGNDTTTAIATVNFSYKRFWGVSEYPDLHADQISSSELSNSKAKTITYDCSGGKYFYYAIPHSLGNITTTVGGLSYTGWVKTTETITNQYGLEVQYDVYRSGDIQTGSAINVIIS